MNSTEKELIVQLIKHAITKEEFLKRFPVNLKKDRGFIIDTILKAIEDKSADDLDYALPLVLFDDEFNNSEKYVEALRRLLYEKWHHRHEDVVSLLQGLRSPKTIEALYETALTKFDYLEYDDSYALARKVIHALGDINTEEAKEKLRLLASSDNLIIKEKAEKQLYYRKR